MKVTLKTNSGHYLCAEDGGKPQGEQVAGRAGGLLTANRAVSGAWETFDVVALGPNQVALQSIDGFFLCAEPDASGRIVLLAANRTAIGEWETFTLAFVGGGIGLQCHTGKWLSARAGGGADLTCDRPLPDQEGSMPGPWETFTPSDDLRQLFAPAKPAPTATVTPPIIGRLQLRRGGSGWVVVDDTGPVNVVGLHFGEAFSLWVHDRQDECRAQVRRGRTAGAKVIRSFNVLGYYDQGNPLRAWKSGKAWFGREVTPVQMISYSERTIPATPNYYDKFRDFLTMLAEEQMGIFDDNGDMVSWSEAQAIEHMRVKGLVYKQLGDVGRSVLAGLWACNEGWQNLPGVNPTPELCAKMLNAFHAGAGWLPDLRGFSCAEQGEEIQPALDWAAPPATVITVHGSRAVNPHLIAHYFGYGLAIRRPTGQVLANTEPIGGGPGVSVGQENDPEVLTAIHAINLIVSGPTVHMSGNGVFYNGPIEDHPAFHEVLRIPTFLPDDVQTYPVASHSGRSQQHRFIEVGEDEGDPRFDFKVDPGTGRFAGVLHAWHWKPVKMLKSCRDFNIRNLVTGDMERTGPIAAGAVMDHPYRRARLVTGTIG